MGSSPPVEGEPTLGVRRRGVLAPRTLLLCPKESLAHRKLLQHLPLPLPEGAGDADLPQYFAMSEDDWAVSSQTCCCPPPPSSRHPGGGTAPPPSPAPNVVIQVIYITCSCQVFVFPILQSPPDMALNFRTCQLHTAWELLHENGGNERQAAWHRQLHWQGRGRAGGRRGGIKKITPLPPTLPPPPSPRNVGM